MHRNILATGFRSLLLFTCIAIGVGCGVTTKVTVNELPSLQPRTGPNDSLFLKTLTRVVKDSGEVDYVSAIYDSSLTEYLREIAVTHTDAFVSRSAALAFWINAHNAFMLDLIRLNYPLSGKIDISQYRSAKVFLIGDKKYSVLDIEHEVLTQQFKDPRAFFALYFGGISSPKLSNKPYVEAELSSQLDQAVTAFVADPRRVALDRRTYALLLSHLFSDYAPELAQASGSVQAFVRSFASGKLGDYLVTHPNAQINYLPYYWTQ